jgi:type IV pilus assembly protein PilF
MRLRDGVLLAAVVGIALTGCSRLTFVKPDAQRRGGERVAPEYAFKETEASRQRTRARHLVASAGQKYAAGTLDAAAADARAALKIDPTQAAAHTMLGLVASASGDTGAAGTHYARAAELAPGDGLVLNNYGAWLCGNGQAAAALGWFDQALQDPGYTEREAALSNAGACAAKAGRHDLVEPATRAALEIAPENVVALQALSEHTFNAGRYLEARAFSQRRLASAPATPDALRLASQIEEKLGDTVAATRYVQRLNTEFPQARNAGPGEAELP